jgi:hypothetical protein
VIKTLTINSIFAGHSASQYFGHADTINTSIAIDPDLPILSTDTRTSGFVVPVGSAVFSGANVTSQIVRILNNPKNTLTYVVLTNGRLISYSSSLGSETLIGTVAGGAAVWAEYYNNFIYIWTPTNISRYGPLNNSPTLTDTVWTGATLGTQTALTNTTYPTLRSASVPNHVAHVHGDNSMYFTDFINGQGLIHRINTKKVTDEGDTNGTTVVSAYNALDLPFGFYPTSIESFSKSLLITGIYTIDTTVNQGKSAFVLWDPTDTVSFYLGPIFLPDPLVTASLNVNGPIYIWSGNAQNGVRLSKYTGGESVSEIVYQEEGLPPLAGAVDALGNRIVWGGFTTNPEAGSCVWAWGSKDARLPVGLHNVSRTSSTGATPTITALKYVLQSSNVTPKLVTAWLDGTTRGLDQYSTTATLDSNIRWLFNTGNKGDIKEIKIPLGGAVAANTTITPTLYFDDFSTSKALTVINNTNYPSKRKIIYKGTELKDTTFSNNFGLEFTFTGTNPLPIGLPITIDVDIKEDEAT